MNEINLEVTFACDNAGSTKGLLMVLQGEVTLHTDRMDIAKSRDRTAFLNKLRKACPNIDTGMVEQQMLEEVRRSSETSSESAAQPTELSVSRIVRPHLFHVPGVSGLLVPQARVTGGGAIEGRWLLFVRWSHGKREQIDLGDVLDVGDNDRIWFHPKPPAPLPNTIARWSRTGRKRWLKGHTPDVKRLFTRLFDQFEDFLEFPREDAVATVSVLSLWTMLTYVYPVWPAVPYLSVGGPLGSGKSRVFEVLGLLVYNPLHSSNVTAPCLFRTLHVQGVTVLLDEAERLRDRTPDAGEIRSILLAGYKRGGQATRMERVGETFKSVSFDVYGPKAIAGIACLPAALASRCIPIMMFRAGKRSPVPKRRIDPTADVWRDLRDDLNATALAYGPTFVQMPMWPVDCADLNGRALELWQPILAMAQFVENAGMPGLVEMIQQHAVKALESADEDIVSEVDDILLRLLKQRLDDQSWGVTASEILKIAKEQEPSLFTRYSARGVGAVFNRYGIKSQRSGGKRLFRATIEQWKAIEESYGIDLGQAAEETDDSD